MIKSIIILNILILIKCRQFGANLLINSNFSQPSLIQLSPTPPLLDFLIFPSIPGWQCTTGCEVDSCPQLTKQYVYFGDCDNQILDINPNTIGTIYQQFNAQAGPHLLQVQFLLALFKSNLKTFLIYFNGVQIYRFKALTQYNFFRYNFSSQIIAIQGINNISFTMETLYIDGSGYRLCYVSIRKTKDVSYEEKLHIISSPILQNLIKIPAIRIILGQIVNFFVPFDRLQLYYFHNRDISYNTKEFLKRISTLLAQKGAFSQKIIQILFNSAQNNFQMIIDRLSYKSKYIGKSQRNQPESGLGFLQNNFYLFFYSLPFFALFIILFYGLFRLSFHQRISMVFRKYCFKGIIILMIFEGNIQQFSFYLFGQIFYLFSTQFSHKLVNVFMIMFLFFLLLASTFIYLWFKFIYKKLSFYFIQGTVLSYSGIIIYSLDKGLFCFILGAVHQIGISSPNRQLLMLTTVEVCWIFSQMNGLWRKFYNNSMFVWLSIIQGILRIIFLASLYGYQLAKGDYTIANFINSQVHFTIIQLFFSVWIISFFMAFASFCLKSSYFICPRNPAQKIISTNIHENLPMLTTPIHKNKLTSNYYSSRKRVHQKINSHTRKIYYLIHRKQK